MNRHMYGLHSKFQRKYQVDKSTGGERLRQNGKGGVRMAEVEETSSLTQRLKVYFVPRHWG